MSSLHAKRPGDPVEHARVRSGEIDSPERSVTPRHSRNAASWIVVLVAVAAITAGIAVGEVLLLLAGMVLAASTGHLFQPPVSPARRRQRHQRH